MHKYGEIILRFFIEKNQVKEGAAYAAALIKKEKGVELEELYHGARDIESKGLIEIQSLKKGEIGDKDKVLGFWVELTQQGEDYIKKDNLKS